MPAVYPGRTTGSERPLHCNLFGQLLRVIRDVLLPFQPVGPFFHIVIASQVDKATIRVLVQLVKIRQIQAGGSRRHGRVVQVWCDMLQVFCDVARPEFFTGMQINKRSVVQNIGRDLVGLV